MWKNVQPAPPDSILGLTEQFKKDQNQTKGVGPSELTELTEQEHLKQAVFVLKQLFWVPKRPL